MRGELTRGALRELMAELARTAPAGKSFQVHVVGGGTAVLAGWRAATIDAENFIRSGMVDPSRFRALVAAIPDSGYLKYPQLDRAAVESAVDRFLSRLDSPR